uniref:uncharacterized protein LOC132662737 n=1 Tax=Panthera onca TaxID=9690 RepID=UPI00295533BA|nr:uncharacterized protein LOC132662737 [Panthera onca]XP_060464095.1 uncharacterized protein LOC132662737 [Panthera onca]
MESDGNPQRKWEGILSFVDQIASGNVSGSDEGRHGKVLLGTAERDGLLRRQNGCILFCDRSVNQTVTGQKTHSSLVFGLLPLEKQSLRDEWEREGCFIQEAGDLGTWQTDAQRPSPTVQVKLGKVWPMVRRLHAGEAGARHLVICRRDSEKTCWWQRWLFSEMVKTHLLGKSGPSFLAAGGLQNPGRRRSVLLQTVGLRPAKQGAPSWEPAGLHWKLSQIQHGRRWSGACDISRPRRPLAKPDRRRLSQGRAAAVSVPSSRWGTFSGEWGSHRLLWENRRRPSRRGQHRSGREAHRLPAQEPPRLQPQPAARGSGSGR